jgi:hypothetical protein
VEGCDRLFQLLVEVKVDAGVHQYSALNGLWQPEAYIAAWKQETIGARVRRVGTLTRGGPGYRPPADEWRAPDVSWHQVRELVVATPFPAEVATVADEFVHVLDGVVLKENVTMTAELREWAIAFLNRVTAQLRVAMDVTKTGSVFRRGDYVGRYLSLVTPDAIPFRLWFAVTERGARYNQPLHEAFVWVLSADNETLHADLPARLHNVGFMWLKDREGWTRWRRGEQVAHCRSWGPSTNRPTRSRMRSRTTSCSPISPLRGSARSTGAPVATPAAPARRP